MVFPFGEWLLFSLSFLAWLNWPIFRFTKSLRFLPLAWLLGWIFEQAFTYSEVWDWHFSRIFVLIVFTWIAWQNTSGRRLPSILLAALSLLTGDLFVLNEPGIFVYDQWLFASIFVAVAFFSTRSLWGLTLALSGGMLLNMVFTVFLYDGVVRYFNLPSTFVWHFSVGACVVMAAFKQISDYWQDLKRLRMDQEYAVPKSGREEIRGYRKDD